MKKTFEYLRIAVLCALGFMNWELSRELREARRQSKELLGVAQKSIENAKVFRQLVLQCVDDYAPISTAADLHKLMADANEEKSR